MAKPWSETKSLFLILSLAVVTALPSVSSISMSKLSEEIKIEEVSADRDVASAAEGQDGKLKRVPSSVNEADLGKIDNSQVLNLKTEELKVLYVNCKEAKSNFEDLSSSSVRLRFDNCADKSKKGEIKDIVNKTNGFTAQLFKHKDVWSTDYIDLSKGTNEIEIRYVNKSGKLESQLLHLTHVKAKD